MMRPEVGHQQADRLLDQRGLAGAVRPEQTVDLARLDPEGDVVVGGQRAEPLGEALDAKAQSSLWRARILRHRSPGWTSCHRQSSMT